MKTKLTLPLIVFSILLIMLTGCKKDPNHNTSHPEHGKIVLDMNWPSGAAVPENYTVHIGEHEAQLQGKTGEFPELLLPGDYRMTVFNKPAGITFDGFNAAVNEEGGYLIATPEWLYSHAEDITVEKDAVNNFTVKPAPQIRRLDLTLKFSTGDPGLISALGGELSGMARRINTDTKVIDGEAKIKPEFVKEGNEYKAVMRLAGVITTAKKELTVNITLPNGKYTVTSDLNQALADFNNNKNEARNIDLVVKDLGLESVSMEVASWSDAELGDGEARPEVSDKYISIIWPGEAETITAIEITDNEGGYFASLVEGGRTTGMIVMPETINSLFVYQEGVRKDVMNRMRDYDPATYTIHFGETDALFVRTREDLDNIRYNMSADYIQLNDIDLGGEEWAPIGAYKDESINEPFTGTYDGGGYNIENMMISQGQMVGLFRYNKGTIKDVNIASGEIEGINFISAICGLNKGRIENCTNRASVNNTYEVSGGIAGLNYTGATITGCTNYGDISGKDMIGGIAGENYGTVSYCINEHDLTVEKSRIGGIVGWSQAYIDNCRNNGTLTGTSYVGGIAGENNGVISDCVNTKPVTGTEFFTGGIAGLMQPKNILNTGGIINCINTAEATVTNGREDAGGIVGENTHLSSQYRCDITACINYADIYGVKNVGGIAGSDDSFMSGCVNNGNIKATGSTVGGIVGNNYFTTIACYNTGDVEGGNWVGGLIGWNRTENPNLVACYNTGKTTATNTENTIVGAICGINNIAARIIDCYYLTGDIAVGENKNTTGIVNAYKFKSASNPGGKWPSANYDNGWALADGNNGPSNYYYWLTFGNPDSSPVEYPKLWWEAGSSSAPANITPTYRTEAKSGGQGLLMRGDRPYDEFR